ncbi:MAG: zinc-binding dehydrogenase [Miniphocaeibacter sp.]|uniref:zinc-binding dehydrogenase n=1 Tax=Miniphocaeibacter sp. TaxID=3100973 RepID=UPI00180C4559|nr:zinc-binding dehydrogenase [Gallicola sp.]
MKTKALRMYGADDIRLEEFELPEIKDDEILVKVVTDSICMSTYKLVKQGKKHKRAPQNIDTNPVILGHEFAGDIVKVGKKWQDQFKPGQKFAQQPALNYKGSLASPGYSYEFFGGDCTYCIIPPEVMELGCLLNYDGESYFEASLGEPMSCIIGGYHANYHTNKQNYDHEMGIKKGGNVIILGGIGPMGLGAVSYGLYTDKKPKRIVVTATNDEKIERAKRVLSIENAKNKGVELIYVNVKGMTKEEQIKKLMDITDGYGYDDVFVYIPYEEVAEVGDSILAFDGCLNFFAGPTNKDFVANMNLYNVHYTSTHIMGTTGGNTDDLKEALDLSAKGVIKPSVMITHIGGLDSAADTTLNLPNIPGGKKLIYTHLEMPLTAIEDFEEKGKEEEIFKILDEICKKHDGLWNTEAEKALFEYYNL